MINLDHAATTPLRPEALNAMLPWFTEHAANANALYAEGEHAHGRRLTLLVGRLRTPFTPNRLKSISRRRIGSRQLGVVRRDARYGRKNHINNSN